MTPGTRRAKFSFSKTDLQRASLKLGCAGVALALPSDEKARNSFMASFALADTNKFYPGLNVKNDVAPKPEDFIDVPFRLLSATIVAGGTWRATDFSDENVLKASISRMLGKPVYKDHDTDLDNWVGLVKAPKWTAAFTSTTGVAIPAGIDGIISIDAKTNPKIARGVLVGGIFSNSVTVEFDWVPSHDFESDDEFEMNVGSIIDGKMVCRKCTKIWDYYESSLVWLGADPYAKLIDNNGDLVNVDTTSTYDDAIVQTTYKKDKKYAVNSCLSKNVLSLSRPQNPTKPSNSNPMNEELLKALRILLGLADDAEITAEMVSAIKIAKPEDATALAASQELAQATAEVITELTGEEVKVENLTKAAVHKLKGHKAVKTDDLSGKDAQIVTLTADKATLTTDKANLTAQVTTLTSDKQALTTEVETLKPDATLGKQFVSDKRAECIRLYKIAVDNKPVEAVINLMNNAKNEELDGLLTQYTKGVTMKFTGTCVDCGSHNFQFKSSLGGVQEVIEQEDVEPNDFMTIHDKFSTNSMNLARK